MKYKQLVDYSQRLKSVSSRNEKIGIIVDFLKRLASEEGEIGVNYIAGLIRQGKVSIGWSGLLTLSKWRKRDWVKMEAAIGLSGRMDSSVCASVLKKSLKNKIIIKISLLFLKRNKESYLWYILYLKRPISRGMNNPDTISPEWAIDCIKIGNIITDENYSIRYKYSGYNF